VELLRRAAEGAQPRDRGDVFELFGAHKLILSIKLQDKAYHVIGLLYLTGV
jgi:hypothetical protein